MEEKDKQNIKCNVEKCKHIDEEGCHCTLKEIKVCECEDCDDENEDSITYCSNYKEK